MKRIKIGIATALVALGLIGTPLTFGSLAFASVNPQAEACAGTGGTLTGSNCSGNSSQADLGKLIGTLVNILLYIIGAVAVIMIIVGAFRFVTSSGNASSVTAAKNTILYAVVGLVIALLAYAIVNFVITSF